MRDLFDAVAKASGCKRVKTILPASLAMAMAAVAELVAGLVRKPTIRTRFTIYNLVRNNNFSSEKAAKELGYTSRPFDETIRDEIRWFGEEGVI